MSRQSISLTAPNDAWLKAQVESEEFASKSEAINDLIRRARRLEEAREFIRSKLIRGEESIAEHGYSTKTKDELLDEIKTQARKDGLL